MAIAKGTFYLGKYTWDEDDADIRIKSFKPDTGDDFMLFKTVELEIECDKPKRIELRNMKIKTLNEEAESIRAVAQTKLEDIEDTIQRLMALT